MTTRFVQGFIAAVVATLASVFYTFQAMWCSGLLFDHWYPHDGEIGLGVWMVGLVTLLVGFGTSFWAAMVFQINKEKRRQQDGLQLGEERFSITDRSVNEGFKLHSK